MEMKELKSLELSTLDLLFSAVAQVHVALLGIT